MANLFLYLALFLLVYVVLSYLLNAWWLFRVLKHDKVVKKFSENKEELPMVSILIPAHNEQLVIENTLQAMVNLDYPKDKLEVIPINDNSNDDTGFIVDEYAKRYPLLDRFIPNRQLVGRENQAL